MNLAMRQTVPMSPLKHHASSCSKDCHKEAQLSKHECALSVCVVMMSTSVEPSLHVQDCNHALFTSICSPSMMCTYVYILGVKVLCLKSTSYLQIFAIRTQLLCFFYIHSTYVPSPRLQLLFVAQTNINIGTIVSVMYQTIHPAHGSLFPSLSLLLIHI